MVTRWTVLALGLALAGCAPGGDPGTSVNSAEAHQLVAAGAVLLDVRTPEEFRDGHVEGARNIPVDEVAQRLAELSRDRVVVVYCHSGARSARAAGVLRRAGYRVRDLGPMRAW
ncbi:MAG: rhodanese-like domain-containing protein [Polyangiales bacterium]